MAVNITSNYPGEFLDNLLTKATIQNEFVQKGLIHIEANILKKLFIGKLIVGKLLQQHKAMPTAVQWHRYTRIGIKERIVSR